ncbi:integrator complex subunit 5-like [Clytia hemisphaerica]|uniref:Integrator complex subunit 5 n=1 Tax=Clytia hemisphaerica TaxID=252671 RepID=A0A7M5XHH2_9CNID
METQQYKVTLKDVTSFLSKNDEKIEERTNYAITLLQSLPCARYAVLEKIGEVFFDEAQRYIVELERQHLEDGGPLISETATLNHDIQIKKIKHVLISSIESNSKAWAPLIFQWAVQTGSQICSQYGTSRHFSIMPLEERLQMWLACSATNSLMEITITCMKKLIDKNEESCVKSLLGATLSCSPFFDWALAHLSCAFPSIVPNRLLWHALDAFSKQSRKAEVIKETILSIFDLMMPKIENHIQNCIQEMFMSSLVEVKSDEDEKSHTLLCIIPFLLHLGVAKIELFTPIVGTILDQITSHHLQLLQEQSKLREDVLQRSIVRRTVNCLKMMTRSTYKILQYLIKYTCMEDTKLCKEHPDLAKSVQNVAFVILESLLLQLRHDVHLYARSVKEPIKIKGEDPMKAPFLHSLTPSTKQCCQQLSSSSGTKKEILQDFVTLMALQEGREKMKEILSFILVNTTMESDKNTLTSFLNDFGMNESKLFEETVNDVFNSINLSSPYTASQVNKLLRNLRHLYEQKDESLAAGTQIKKYIGVIAKICISVQNESVLKEAFRMLETFSAHELRMSEYALVAQAVLHNYFKMFTGGNTSDQSSLPYDLILKNLTNTHKPIQQYVIRLLVEAILKKDKEHFDTEPEESSEKSGLMDKNYKMIKQNRFHGNITSMVFKDGLRLNKRSLNSESSGVNQSNLHQRFMKTLFLVLSTNSGYASPKSTHEDDDDEEMKSQQTFFTSWEDAKFSRAFPTGYAYTANLLVELVCPECVPVCPWPDEDFLKYTIERDLKVKNAFDQESILWDVLDLVSTARPSLYHCSVLIQSLFGTSLNFWQSNRRPNTTSTPKELANIRRILNILKQAGWIPSDFDSIDDIFPHIKPKEVYNILSAIWKYLKISNNSPDRFIDRDQLGRPQPAPNPENVQIVRGVIKIVFFQNITKIGHMCKRFLAENPS